MHRCAKKLKNTFVSWPKGKEIKVKRLILVEMKVLSFKTREKVDYLWYGGGGGRSFGGLSFFFPVSFFQNPL